MAILRPTSEVSNIGWTLTGGADYATILSDQSDATYISQNSAVGSDMTVGLASGVDPGVDTGFTVYARARMTGTDAELNLGLYQGGTLIKDGTITITGSFSDLPVALSAGEASSITDFTTLRIRADGGGGDIGGMTLVSDVWLELADIPAGEAIADRCVVQCHHPAPTISAISGVSATSKDVVKADYPIDLADALGGQICSWSGLWYPARRIVIVDGLPFGDDNAPKESNPNPGETLP